MAVIPNHDCHPERSEGSFRSGARVPHPQKIPRLSQSKGRPG